MCMAGRFILGAIVTLTGIGITVYLYMNYLLEERVYFGTNRYLVNSSKCHIPDVDPRHPSIVKYTRLTKPVVCSRQPPLTYTAVIDGQQVLRVDKGAVSSYTSSLEPLTCCYSVITRENEFKTRVSKCERFQNEVILDKSVEFIYVQCSINDIIIYYNLHAVVPIIAEEISIPHALNNSIEKGIKNDLLKENTPTPNVIILGIDSMSRLNFIRTMPRTVAYLKSKKWFEFRGYTKIADHTRPNVLAFLTGKDYSQLASIDCYPTTNHSLDHCPYIWKDFKRNGYVTGFAEDTKKGSTFYFSGTLGFREKPTDYFLIPFIQAAESEIPTQESAWNHLCHGPTPATDYVLNYTLDILKADNKKASFILSWLNNFSHDDNNVPVNVDERFIQFMEDLTSTQKFNNTFVIFLSDHGMRFGNVRKTYVGWLEERLPFFYMSVPVWFREKYPDAYKNLQDNQDKLTSTYDLYMTLRDIVDGTVGKVSKGCEGCPTCGSLFSPVKSERNCSDAGIPPHFCACAPQSEISPEDRTVQKAAYHAVRYVNKKVAATNNKCARVTLDTVSTARLKANDDKNDDTKFEDYVVVFSTTPGDMLFDATVRHWLNKDYGSSYEVLGMISRINKYKGTSECMDDKALKLYCFCV